MVNIGVFNEEKVCSYRGELYSVRDNGAVCRHARDVGKKRRLDEVWTFGTVGVHGHLYLAGEAVHRIVATAFHGGIEKTELIVDHIDTNRVNNRPENLRWLTRLENILKNDQTVRKIELATGLPIDDVLSNIEILHNLHLPGNFSWMTQVDESEARQAMETRKKWLKEAKSSSEYERTEHFYYYPSLTPKAAQVNQWRTLGYFPCVERCSEVSLEAYAKVLREGDNVYLAQSIEGYAFYADKWEISPDGKNLWIVCHQKENAVKPFVLMSVECKNGFLIHSCQVFFDENVALKYFELAMGRDWTGPDPIDDFC